MVQGFDTSANLVMSSCDRTQQWVECLICFHNTIKMFSDDHMEDVDDPHEKSGEEEYDEHADEDFDPEKATADEDNSSSSDDEGEGPSKPVKKTPRKRKSENVDEDLDSGDEATIKERKRKKRRKETAEDQDSGGEGGFIRTRAQRVVEKEERKHRKRARDGEVTIDVNQVWADLSSVPVGRVATVAPRQEVDAMDVDAQHDKENAPEQHSEDMITIKRFVNYAGMTEEVEETVLRSSKEAQKYFAEHPDADPKHRMHDVDSSGLHKPLKRPSMFEPNPPGLVKGVLPEKLRLRAPTRMDVLMAQKRSEEKTKAQKLSTVQKSARDWKGFLDNQEGLRDELQEYGKSKKGFLEREAFLDRAAGAREQAARDARLKS